MRCENYLSAVRFTVHFAFMVTLGPLLHFANNPNLSSALGFLMPATGWCVDMSFHKGLFRCTSRNVRAAITVNLIAVTLNTLFATPQSREELAALEIQQIAANLLTSMVSVDCLFTVPFCGIAFIVALYKQAVSPFGPDMDDLAATAIVEKAAGHLLVALAAVFMERSVRARILADLASEDSSRLLSSFRCVLKGVCEGEVVLDSTCKFVGRTECLEQLLGLAPEELSSKAFVDLLQDEDSHQKFSQFIAASEETASIPAGLRVSFQTAHGSPCSVDLFHVLVPNLFQEDGQAQHLIVLKEDAESRIRRAEPDGEACDIIRDWHARRLASEGPSSEGDTLDVYEELQCMTLLVNPEDFGDIEEAHLKFQRQSSEPQMRLGMPTLRRFTVSTDWSNLRQKLQSYLQAVREQQAPESMLLGPLLFRLPGESRSFLQARHVSLGPAMGHGPPRFWLLMKDFNPTRVRNLKLQADIRDGSRADHPQLMAAVQPGATDFAL